MSNTEKSKPLGIKAYGSIPHLPGSRMGPADHHCHEGQARICLEKMRDKHDEVFVQEKLDGSCVAVAKINSEIIALSRAGYTARSSPYLQHHMFADWVRVNEGRFQFLKEGQRVVGEWLAQAHGTRYELKHEPFVAFDLMTGGVRTDQWDFEVLVGAKFITPGLIGQGPMAMGAVLEAIKTSNHGALDPVEGVVFRVERKGQFDFLAKWVRPDKVDGRYLESQTGGEAVWNWKP